MDNESISNNSTRHNSFSDAPQELGYSRLSSSAPSILSLTTTMMTTTTTTTTTSAMDTSSDPLSTTTDREQRQQQIIPPTQSETICISSDDADDDNNNNNNNSDGNANDSSNREEHTEEEMTNILPQDWLPAAASTPLSTGSIDTAAAAVRSEKEIENDLFNNIEQLVCEFVNRPNRQYPYYRIMRWTIGEHPKIEHLVTVIINRPTIIL